MLNEKNKPHCLISSGMAAFSFSLRQEGCDVNSVT
jgi:hypothetical protein